MADVVPGSSHDPLVREALVACRLFAGLDASKMDLVVGALRARRFRRGEVIFHGGDPGDSLFIVASGSVKILVDPEDGSEPAILTTVGAGRLLRRAGAARRARPIRDGGRRRCESRRSSSAATPSTGWSTRSRPSAARCSPRSPGRSAA